MGKPRVDVLRAIPLHMAGTLGRGAASIRLGSCPRKAASLRQCDLAPWQRPAAKLATSIAGVGAGQSLRLASWHEAKVKPAVKRVRPLRRQLLE